MMRTIGALEGRVELKRGGKRERRRVRVKTRGRRSVKARGRLWRRIAVAAATATKPVKVV